MSSQIENKKLAPNDKFKTAAGDLVSRDTRVMVIGDTNEEKCTVTSECISLIYDDAIEEQILVGAFDSISCQSSTTSNDAEPSSDLDSVATVEGMHGPNLIEAQLIMEALEYAKMLKECYHALGKVENESIRQ